MVRFRIAGSCHAGLSRNPSFARTLACFHAELSGLAGQAGSGVSADEAEAEAARAMECLSRAVAAGYRNTNQIRIESALDPLRGRADFNKLITELEKNRSAHHE